MQKIIPLCALILGSINAGFAGNWGFGSSSKIYFNQALDEAVNDKASSQYEVGRYYLEGYGTDINYKQGFLWLKKSYVKGYVLGALPLGMCYLSGLGGEQDLKKAQALFERASSQETPFAKTAKTYNILCQLFEKKIEAQKAFQEWTKLSIADCAACYCIKQGCVYNIWDYKSDELNEFFLKLEENGGFNSEIIGDLFNKAVIEACFKAYYKK